MKQVIIRSVLTVGLLVFSQIVKCQEWTAYNTKIVSDVFASNDAYYVTDTTSAWGSAGCPNAIYLAIKRTEPAAREIFALVLTAKASNRKISAFGTCNGTNYFNTSYVILH